MKVKLKNLVARIGGYLIIAFAIFWMLVDMVPRLLDSASDIGVAGGVALFLVGGVVLVYIGIDIGTIVKRFSKEKK